MTDRTVGTVYEEGEDVVGLPLLLEMAESGHGDRVALGTSRDGLTFAELAEFAKRSASHIASLGVTHVVHIGRNGPRFPELLFAANIAGVPFVPISYRLTRGQVAGLLDQLDDPIVVVDEDYRALVDDKWRVIGAEEFFAAARRTEALVQPVGEPSAAVLLFTSGTTSTPKAVVLTGDNLASYVFSTVEFGGASPGEAALVAVPPYHIAAVGSVISNLYAGRRVAYLPDFDATEWLRLIREEQITTAMVVPTMLARIVDVLDGTPADCDNLRQISYGGARMPRPVLERALSAFAKVGFCNAYGLTETSSTIALLTPDDHRDALNSTDPDVRARLSSAGKLVPGIEGEVRDIFGKVQPTGVQGELWVRGSQVAATYLGRGSSLDSNGWFCTRDLGRFDEAGYLFIEGRADDTIIRGGENIAPAEIEDVLRQHPGVKDVAVIGVPDEDWGERILAIVVTAGAPIEADELREFARERLRSSRTPDEIIWKPELPHSATGKLLRRELVSEFSNP